MKKGAVVAFILCISIPSVSCAANGLLYLSPARETYTMDQVFEVEVRADTDGAAANAAEADLSFNPDALMVESIGTDGSVLSLWPTPPEYSNTKGTIRFSGTAGQGFTAHDAMLVRIRFRPISIMPGDVHFDSGALLLNDARATNIITGMRSALYTIEPHRVQAPVSVATDTPPASEPSPEVKGVSAQVPAITGYDDRVAVGGRIILQGSASPDTTVHVLVRYEDDTPIETKVLSAHDGSFTVSPKVTAQTGVYRAWAEVRTESETLTSDTVTITADADNLAAVAASLTPLIGTALPYLLLLIVAGICAGYFYNRRASHRRDVY